MQKNIGPYSKKDTRDLKQAQLLINQLYTSIQMPPDTNIGPLLRESSLLRRELNEEEMIKHQSIREMLVAISSLYGVNTGNLEKVK
jgi:hypothetical protein